MRQVNNLFMYSSAVFFFFVQVNTLQWYQRVPDTLMYWFYTCDPYKYTISGVRFSKIVIHIPHTAYVCPAACMGFVSSCHKTLEWKIGTNCRIYFCLVFGWGGVFRAAEQHCCRVHVNIVTNRKVKISNVQSIFPYEFWSKLSFMIVRQVRDGIAIGSISIGRVSAFAAWLDTGRQADSWILLVSYGATDVTFQSNIR